MSEPTIKDLEDLANKYGSNKPEPGNILSIFESLFTGDLDKITDEEWEKGGVTKEDLNRKKQNDNTSTR